MRKRLLSALSLLLLVVALVPVKAEEQATIKELHANYLKAADKAAQQEIIISLSKKTPKTVDDATELRSIFSQKGYDENLFDAAIESLKRISDNKLEGVLIEMLKDEKPFAEKAAESGKTEGEKARRVISIMFIMEKLAHMKSRTAVPLLKEYLNYPSSSFYASQALAAIGDTSASEQIKGKAYQGEEINYAGQGFSEALTVIRDLEDKGKKDKWPKIAKQIILIRDRKAKPSLKRLFNHEENYVRWEAASKFRQLVDESDVPTIIEMTRNKDEILRAEAIHTMKKLKNMEFGDELIELLNDRDVFVRAGAAKALGYKKIMRAVPFLEKAIKDSELRVVGRKISPNEDFDELCVREEAFIALYILTDRKYDFKGKTDIVEWKAERQKNHPTFFGE